MIRGSWTCMFSFWFSLVSLPGVTTLAESLGCLTNSTGRESFLDFWFKSCPMSFFFSFQNWALENSIKISSYRIIAECRVSLLLLLPIQRRHYNTGVSPSALIAQLLWKQRPLWMFSWPGRRTFTTVRRAVHRVKWYHQRPQMWQSQGDQTKDPQIIWLDPWHVTFSLMKCRWLGSSLRTLILGTCLALHIKNVPLEHHNDWNLHLQISRSTMHSNAQQAL